MTDQELVENAKSACRYLMAHNRLQDCDTISRLCARLQQVKEQYLNSLLGELFDANVVVALNELEHIDDFE